MVIDAEKLAKLQSASRIGGKGTPRRKVVRKPKGPGGADADKKLQNALKKLNVQPLTGIEEVNMFKDDGNVLHFQQPKSECARQWVAFPRVIADLLPPQFTDSDLQTFTPSTDTEPTRS
jgi:hypothetical protein